MGPLARIVSGRRSKWVVIGLWLLLVVGAAPFAGKLESVLVNAAVSPDQLADDAPGRQIAEALRERFPGGEARLALVAYRRDGGLRPGDRELISDDAAEIQERVEAVTRVIPPFGEGSQPGLVASNGELAVTAVPISTPEATERVEAVEEVREIASEGAQGLATHVTGPAPLEADLSSALMETDVALLAVTGLLVLLLLLAIYRAPVVALVPLTVVVMAIVVAAGLIYVWSDMTDRGVDRGAISVFAVLMFGAGTDYCLLLVARYTRNLRSIEDKHHAVEGAVRHSGGAILASGLTVAGALLALLVAELEQNSVLAPVLAIGVTTGLLASLTLLPAVLAVVGRSGFWPSRGQVRYGPEEAAAPSLLPGLSPLPAALRASTERAGVVSSRPSRWQRFGERVIRRPVVALVGIVALFGIGAVGLTTYEQSPNAIEEFRSDVDSTRGFKVLSEGFPPGALFPNNVLIAREDGPLSPADIEAARSAAARVENVAAVSPVVNRSEDGGEALFTVAYGDDPFEEPALARTPELRRALGEPAPGVTGIVGDGSAGRFDYTEGQSEDRKRVIPLVLVVILITLIVLLRAIVAPLYLLASVLLSFFGTVGISLVIFDVLLGQEVVEPSYLLLSFIFLVALGVDYNIFLMSEVRGEALRHGTRQGLLRALVATGPVITSAGLILAGTFGTLTILPLNVLLELGITVALGVVLDTFLVRTILVPALVQLAGDASWWPSRPGTGSPVVSGVHALPKGPLAQATGAAPPE